MWENNGEGQVKSGDFLREFFKVVSEIENPL